MSCLYIVSMFAVEQVLLNIEYEKNYINFQYLIIIINPVCDRYSLFLSLSRSYMKAGYDITILKRKGLKKCLLFNY